MRFIALIALVGFAPLAGAQDARPPPAKAELPSPESVEPGVATSPPVAAPAQAPAPSAASKPAADTKPPPAAEPAPKQGGSKRVMDRIELDTTQITGNRELPKVLYIVPWKQSDLGDLMGRPANSLLDEVLAPVDREVFRRENRYYDALRPDAVERTDKAEK